MMAAARDDSHRLEWRLHGRSRQFQRRVDQARRIVAESLMACRPYVAVSGGKDSVAVAGLVRSVDPTVPLWHIDSGAESPDTVAVIRDLDARFGIQVAHPEYTMHQMARMVGEWGYDGADRLDGDWHWRGPDWKAVLIEDPSRRIRADHGLDGVITGMRADESRARTMRMRKYGPCHHMAEGWWSIAPLAWWSGIDSLAYAEVHDLPVSDVYLRPGRLRPQDRRTGCLLGATGVTEGRLADLRETHPAVWREIVNQYPDLRSRS